jgi:radical SAM superfamily enzyme
MEETVRFVAGLRPDGVKIHNLHVPRGTGLFRELQKGEVCAPCGGAHLEYTIRALELLPPDAVILRLVCETPADLLAAPLHFPAKAEFRSLLVRTMERRGTRQGRLFDPSTSAPAH